MWIIIIIVVIILISIIAKIFEWLRDNIGKILLVIGIIVAIFILIYLIGTYPDIMKTVGFVALCIIGAVIVIALAVLIIRGLISIIAKIFKWFKDNIGKALPVIGIIVAIPILIYLVCVFPGIMKTIGIVLLWIIGAVIAIALAVLVISVIKSAVRERQKRLEAERIRKEEERQRIIKSAFEKTQTEVENCVIANKTNDIRTIYNSLSEPLIQELGILKHENCVDNAYDEKMVVAFFCKESVTYYFLKKLLREERGFTREGAVEYCRSNQLMFEKIDDDISQMLAENLIKKTPMGSKDVLFSSNLPGNIMKSIDHDEIICD